MALASLDAAVVAESFHAMGPPPFLTAALQDPSLSQLQHRGAVAVVEVEVSDRMHNEEIKAHSARQKVTP